MANNPVTRRTALGAAAVGVAALEATQAMAQADTRKTFVLVHGAWHGGWCWRRVADILEAARPQGLCAVAHRQRRSLASSEQGRDPRHPHRRHRQPGDMGRPQRHLPGRPFLWRLAGLGRARTDPRPRRGDRLARRVQAGERPEGHRLRLRVQPQGAGGGGGQGRARPQGAAGQVVFASARRITPGSIPS